MPQLQQDHMKTLVTIFSKVMANLAFMFTNEDQVDPPIERSWLQTTISYHGLVSGTLRFRCSKEFSRLLAANLLGVDVEDSKAESGAEDAVKEFMNILCGQYITEYHGVDAICNLTIPYIQEMDEAPHFAPDENPETASFSVENHMVQLSYQRLDEDTNPQDDS